MITIRVLVLFEALTKRGYQSIGDDEEDSLRLYYAYNVCNGLVSIYDIFKDSIQRSPVLCKEVADWWANVMGYIAQFKTEGLRAENADNSKEAGATTITELAMILITSGISPDYVLNQMDLFLIEPMVRALCSKEQREQENKRLWTFLSLAPYHNKGTKLEDLYRFPWESGENRNDISVVDVIKAINENPEQWQN